MPFSSVLGASSVIKPGVCTSTTRPSTPYIGQMIFETDTNNLLVWNGTAFVAAVPTMNSMISPTSVAGTGVTLSSGRVSFTSATSVSVNGCFSAAYSTYKIVVSAKSGVNSDSLRFRLRAGGTDNSSAIYFTHGIYTTQSAGPTRSYNASETQGYIGWIADLGYSIMLDVHQPFAVEYTSWMSQANGIGSNTAIVGSQWGFHNTATSYDGFTLFTGASAITGTLRIYGYRETL